MTTLASSQAGGGGGGGADWLPSYFASLVESARARWVPLPEAAGFLQRGAARAVAIIEESVGQVGPPVRPEAG